MQDLQQFQAALTFAAELHADQVRKGTGVPYIAHLLNVTGIVLDYGGTETEAIAALLHDAVEDQGGMVVLEQIRHRFGHDVADIVAACSDSFTVPKPPWRQRKDAYLEHLAEAPPSVLIVSAADKLHNARSILTDYLQMGDALFERFRGGKDGTLWYYQALTRQFQAHARAHPRLKPLFDEFDQVARNLLMLAEAR